MVGGKELGWPKNYLSGVLKDDQTGTTLNKGHTRVRVKHVPRTGQSLANRFPHSGPFCLMWREPERRTAGWVCNVMNISAL